MTDEKKCRVCGTTECDNWITKENLAGEKAYFCGPLHYEEYKKKGAETGVCEFC